jgi:hypothetical protein
MSVVLDTSLLAGPLPVVLAAAGVLGGVLLLAVRGKTWWQRAVPGVLAAAAVAIAVLVVVATWVWSPFPDAVPAAVWLCVGAGLAALGLGAARVVLGRGRGAALAGTVLVLLAAAAGVNAHYGEFPTVRTPSVCPTPTRWSSPTPRGTRPAWSPASRPSRSSGRGRRRRTCRRPDASRR